MDGNLKAYLESLSEEQRAKVKTALAGIVQVEETAEDKALAAARLAAGLPAQAPKVDKIREAAGLGGTDDSGQ